MVEVSANAGVVTKLIAAKAVGAANVAARHECAPMIFSPSPVETRCLECIAVWCDFTFVIPGCASWRRPGIQQQRTPLDSGSTRRRVSRNDGEKHSASLRNETA